MSAPADPEKRSPPLGHFQRERKADDLSVEPHGLLKVVHGQMGLEKTEDRSRIRQLFHLGSPPGSRPISERSAHERGNLRHGSLLDRESWFACDAGRHTKAPLPT